jgi:hypothetical protein
MTISSPFLECLLAGPPRVLEQPKTARALARLANGFRNMRGGEMR